MGTAGLEREACLGGLKVSALGSGNVYSFLGLCFGDGESKGKKGQVLKIEKKKERGVA